MPARLQRDRAAWHNLTRQVLVERRLFSRSRWMPHFDRLRRNIEAHSHVLQAIGTVMPEGAPDPRELLIWAWCTLMSMPEDQAQGYAGLKESPADGRGIDELANSLRDSGYRLSGLPTALDNQVRWLAALVRAIDADLAGINFWPDHNSRWSAQDWQPNGYPCFVVPVQRDYRCVDHKERDQRATRYHAIVPSQVGDLTVSLALHAEVTASKPSRAWRYGAAVFDEMVIEVQLVGEDGFVLSDAPCPSAAAIISEQIETAIRDSCDVLAWPELTVPEDRLTQIRSRLGHDPLASPARVPIVVAGSWHLPRGSGHINRAPVLQSRGTPLTHCDKRRQFPYLGKREAITPGREVPVIVMEDRLVGVAICRDFCDDCTSDIYAALCLDLLIVPSMGAASTTEAHERHCKTLQSRQGAVSLIVQQYPLQAGEPSPPAPGYSLIRPEGPAGGEKLPQEQTERLRVLISRR